MDEVRIENFLLNVFDALNNKKDKKYICEVTILTIKSLLPSEEEVGTKIDYKRFKKELELWYFYRNGDNLSLLNSIYFSKEDLYWFEEDDSVYVRIVPIVFSNSKWDIVKEEVLKNILYTTGNINSILEGMLLAKMLFLMANDTEEIVEELKEEIINFSQREFLKMYSPYFRLSTGKYPGNFNVEFERKRIDLISLLNGIEKKQFKVLAESLEVIEKNNFNEDCDVFAKGIYCFKNNISPVERKEFVIYKNFCVYIYKLYKGRIEPKFLAIDNYKLPDIFSLKEGEEFYHSLLNNSKVLKREERNNEIVVYIETKSGIYRFKK